MTQPVITVSIKLTELPNTKNLKTGHFIFEIPFNGLRYHLKFKPSAWNKALMKVEEIESNGEAWQMSIKGNAGRFNAGALTIEGAGIQVFSKDIKD